MQIQYWFNFTGASLNAYWCRHFEGPIQGKTLFESFKVMTAAFIHLFLNCPLIFAELT